MHSLSVKKIRLNLNIFFLFLHPCLGYLINILDYFQQILVYFKLKYISSEAFPRPYLTLKFLSSLVNILNPFKEI